MEEDLSQFGRKIKSKTHFGNQPKNDPNDETIRFKPATKKTWIP